MTDAVYDEAVTFVDNVAFLENGHWPVEEYHYDYETREYVIDKREEDITAETNIVFMDAKGNKKVFSNKDSNGGQMFDLIFPAISGSYYQMLKVVKDDKVSFIKSDGAFFGDELTYYNTVIPFTNDFILVSDDGVTYRAVNSKGEVAADGLEIAAYDKRETADGGSTKNRILIYCDNKTVVFDWKGNSVDRFEGRRGRRIWSGCYVVYIL